MKHSASPSRVRPNPLAVPTALALASLVGLVAALTGDGWRDALSWAGLGAPLLATGWAMRTRRR